MDDLLSIVLELRPADSASTPLKPWYGRAVQALFLNAVRRAHSAALAARMHEENHVRAYTASSLFSDRPLNGLFDPTSCYFLRFTALDDITAAALRKAVLPGSPLGPNERVHLAGADLEIQAAHFSPFQHPLACSESSVRVWSETMQSAGKLPPCLSFLLNTPTFFKETQSASLTPFPSPRLFFCSLADRWKVHMNLEIPPGFRQFVQDHVSLVEDDLCLVTVSDGEHEHCGSVGQLSFECARPASPYWIFAHILARFAFYSGVGKETARGFGQTECKIDQ